VERQLGRTTNEVKKLDQATATAGKSVNGFAQIGAKGFADLGNSAQKSLAGVKELSKNIQGLVQATAGLFIIQQSIQFLRQFSDAVVSTVSAVVKLGDQLDAVSARTGVSVQTLSALKFAAEQTDTSFETLATGVRRLQVALVEAASKSDSEAAKAFAKIGVSATNSAGQIRDVADALPSIAEGIRNLGSDAEQTAAAVALFGRSGQELVPFLQTGAAGMAEMTNQAQRLGAVLSPEVARAASDLDNSLKQLNTALEAMKREIIAPLLGPLNQLAQSFITLSVASRTLGESTPGEAFLSAFTRTLSIFPPFRDALNLIQLGYNKITEEADKAAQAMQRAANAAAGSSNIGALRLQEQAGQSRTTETINVRAPLPTTGGTAPGLTAQQLLALENAIRSSVGVAQIGTGQRQIPINIDDSGLRAQEEAWRRVMGLQKDAATAVEDTNKAVERLGPILRGVHGVFDDLGDVAQATQSRILAVISAFGQLATSLVELVRNIGNASAGAGSGGGGGLGGFLGDLFGGLTGLGSTVENATATGVQAGIDNSVGVRVQTATFPALRVETPAAIPVTVPRIQVEPIPPVQVQVPRVTVDVPRTVLVAPIQVQTPRPIPIEVPTIQVEPIPPVTVQVPRVVADVPRTIDVPPVRVDAPRSIPLEVPRIQVEPIPPVQVQVPRVGVDVPRTIEVSAPTVQVNAPRSIPVDAPRIEVEPVVLPRLAVDVPRLAVEAPAIALSVPRLTVEAPEISVPDLALTAPDLRLEAPDLTLQAPPLELEAPDLRLQAPNLQLQAPDLNVQVPDLRVSAPDLRLEAPDLRLDAPDLRLEAPDLRIPPVSVTVPTIPVDAPRSIRVDVPELKAPTIPPLRVQATPLRVNAPRSIPLDVPALRVTAPDLAVSMPDLTLTAPDLALTAPDLQLRAPDLELKAPKNLALTAPDLELKAPDVNVSMPDFEAGTAIINRASNNILRAGNLFAASARRIESQRLAPSGRRLVDNPDGTVSSERTVTVTSDEINRGRPTNIPTMFGGVELGVEDAIRRIIAAGGRDPETGRQLEAFNSIEEAVKAAQERSDNIGKSLDRFSGKADFSDVRSGASSTAEKLPSLAGRLARIGAGLLGAIPALATFGGIVTNLLSRANDVARERVAAFRNDFQSERAAGGGPNLASALRLQQQRGFIERVLTPGSGPAGMFFAPASAGITAPNVTSFPRDLPFNVNAPGGPQLDLPRFNLGRLNFPRPNRIDLPSPRTEIHVNTQMMDTRGGQEYFSSQEFRNAMAFAQDVRGGR